MEDMEIKNKKLIFCFPYRGAGGVPLLFIRLGNHLKNQGYNITIVDYIDGFMALNNDNNLEFIEYKDNKEINIDKNSILVLQSMTPWSIYPSLNIDKNAKLFFITTIPTNFYPALPLVRDKILKGGIFAKFIWHTILRDEYQKMIQFLKLGLEKKSFVFLDEDIVCNIINSLNIPINTPKLLPLFSNNSIKNQYLNTVIKSDNELIVGWVGRIADFKVHILNKVIEDLKNYSDSNTLKIKFIIVGTGEKENILLKYNTENFSIQRINHIEPTRLDEQLLKFDLYFAMGTSALDGARLGIPTIRLDYSFKKIEDDYKYKFLFDVKGYSLGENIDSKCYNDGLYTIDNVIEKTINQKNDISTLSYDFYNKYHSLDSSAIKFIDFISNAKLVYGDLVAMNLLHSKLYNLWKRLKNATSNQ